MDTEKRPEADELREMVDGCDLLVIPAVPNSLDTDGLLDTLAALTKLGSTKHRVLLTKVPPRPATDGDQLRAQLVAHGFPLFAAEIPLLKAYDKAAAQGVLVGGVHDPRARRAPRTRRRGAGEYRLGERRRQRGVRRREERERRRAVCRGPEAALGLAAPELLLQVLDPQREPRDLALQVDDAPPEGVGAGVPDGDSRGRQVGRQVGRQAGRYHPGAGRDSAPPNVCA